MARIRTRKRGKTYSYIFEAGQVNGKRKVIEKGGFSSEDEAFDAGVAAYSDWKHGNIGITSERMKISDYLAVWLENMKSNVTPATIQSYGERIRVINSYLGDIVLQELRPRDVNYMMQSLYKLGKSYNTIARTKAVLGNALQYAVYPAELIASNPASAVKMPAKAPRNLVKREVISLERFKGIMQEFPFGHVMHIPLFIAYHTGMRIGEILGLTWDNIDFAEGTINITQQMRYIPQQGNFMTPPKTPASRRIIMMDSVLINELKRWRKQQVENELRYGMSYAYAYVDDKSLVTVMSKGLEGSSNITRLDLVCTHKVGKFVSRGCVLHQMRKIGLNAHSFRHTHATTLVENHALPKDVAARLGHADVSITQNLYTHVTNQMRQNTVNILEKALNYADK